MKRFRRWDYPRAPARTFVARIWGFAVEAWSGASRANPDAMEVHGANGYLLDEFPRDGANKRTGPYGDSLENRAQLLFEALDVTIGVCGAERVGLRISPLNSHNSMIDSDPIGLGAWLAGRLNDFGLAYLYVIRRDFWGPRSAESGRPCARPIRAC